MSIVVLYERYANTRRVTCKMNMVTTDDTKTPQMYLKEYNCIEILEDEVNFQSNQNAFDWLK